MKLSKYTQKGKYTQYVFRLSTEDRKKLPNPAREYEIEDIDTTGTVFLKPKTASSIVVSSENLDRKTTKPLQTSFRLHVDGVVKERFKGLCRRGGSTMCRVLSDYICGCVETDTVTPNITVVNQFYGKPRGPAEKIASARLDRKTTIAERAERSEASDTQPQPTDA